ncbi:ADL243Wp [Eremothecium gossypii ATCC 10895]|uniref:ADL243Wp n=1 Tax=Eremothecium gossypii (strain ATCC 10895 / CBS 109.51 / FGSC 9923 / NRRL Y-1056) TaxID=284811 RepID=Q75B20_EREGS|nr:ADL243Wp [Eremothecium gossypii ATCC 10895]AAS51677.1 ADL243Wp [Eremothecium gossypii ATCC 10895]AEY95974.1 FADL243Wp [Eremothecium gossypii FDAG1]
MLRSSISRVVRVSPVRHAQTQAISKAAIADLHSRWEDLPAAEQNDIVAKLSERQKLPWKELTDTEKQAAWYISYGAWGPRRPVHGKGDAAFIAKGVALGVALTALCFGLVRMGAADAPKTMTKEWQLKSDEYLKSKNANPWGGYSQVQSK